MHKEDVKNLEKPYDKLPDKLIDNRFDSAIGADIPSAGKLIEEIFNDFDTDSFGISWWTSLPTEERILISDYLFQCVNGIGTNLVEAKLHYLEWLDTRKRNNEKIADAISRNLSGDFNFELSSPKSPLDELYQKLEELHICGFFRAIGSILDCLGATIIGVLALPKDLRKASINNAKEALKKIKDSGVSNLQTDFFDFYEEVKKSCEAEDWLEWTDQYRNMYVHRGRRTTYYGVVPRKIQLLDFEGQPNLRAESTMHLAKYPDRSDVEAFIKSKDINLSEDAEITLSGIFNSCRNLNENICERLLNIWQQRRSNPTLLEQPLKQWNDNFRQCNFLDYDSNSKPLDADAAFVNPILSRRMRSSLVLDSQRAFWSNSKWK